MFEDNPDEYIRRDIEGSDVGTRRKAACDLIKVLVKFLEPEIKAVFLSYVQVRKIFHRFFLCSGQVCCEKPFFKNIFTFIDYVTNLRCKSN